MVDDGWRFAVDLPEPWAVSDPRAVQRLSVMEGTSSAGTAVREALSGETLIGAPDMVAHLLQFVADETGAIVTVLMASCTVWVYRVADLSGPITEQQSIARAVELAPGVGADFYELAVPVPSSDGELVALLAFATPNIPLAEELANNFRAIATTARFERAA